MSMKRPNILFVFSDQHRHGALGSSGTGAVATPNLDRLAGEGVVFDQAFSCYPLCSPYRAQLLTGTYCHKNLVVCNEYALKGGQPTLAHVLGRAGSRTGFIGKWHLGHGPSPPQRRHGFDYLAGYNCGHGFYKTSYHENERGPIPLDCWAPEGETSLAIRFMGEQQADGGDRPFALLVGWAPPHWPYDEFPREVDTYDPAEVVVPPYLPDHPLIRKELAQYYDEIARFDTHVGSVRAALDNQGVLDRTFIVTDRTAKRFRHNTVDLFIPNRRDCKTFGRQYLECEIAIPTETVRYGSPRLRALFAAAR